MWEGEFYPDPCTLWQELACQTPGRTGRKQPPSSESQKGAFPPFFKNSTSGFLLRRGAFVSPELFQLQQKIVFDDDSFMFHLDLALVT